MKKVFVAINTLGRAGAETALLEFLQQFDTTKYELSLYVMLGQGELVSELPPQVKLLNKSFDDSSVLDARGKRKLFFKVVRAMFSHGAIFCCLPYMIKNLVAMKKKKRFLVEKLLWRVVAEGADRFSEEYDLAIAYLEGAATYYVADHVKAEKKAAFIHVDYGQAGYTRELDLQSYFSYDRIFAVSEEVKEAFLRGYPECSVTTEVYQNRLNPEKIKEKANVAGGFSDAFTFHGKRILTIARLTEQKALDISVRAMRLLKDAGEDVRWYVLGDGEQRKKLSELIEKLGLARDFVLLGSMENPYPFLKKADLYVHASRYEGKSIAVQEAKVLGKPVILSDCSGNREQVTPEADGILCELSPEGICAAVQRLLHDEALCVRLGTAAAGSLDLGEQEIDKILSLMEAG